MCTFVCNPSHWEFITYYVIMWFVYENMICSLYFETCSTFYFNTASSYQIKYININDKKKNKIVYIQFEDIVVVRIKIWTHQIDNSTKFIITWITLQLFGDYLTQICCSFGKNTVRLKEPEKLLEPLRTKFNNLIQELIFM